MPHAKYLSSGPCCSREDFLRFSYMFLGAIHVCDPPPSPSGTNFDPRAIIGTIFVINCIGQLATCQISKLWTLWFQRRRVSKTFLLVAMATRFFNGMQFYEHFGKASCKEHFCKVFLKLA